MNSKLTTVIVDTTRWMSSEERAYIKITSLTGKSITIYKKHLSKMTDDECKLVWFCVNNTSKNKLSLTYEEMNILLKLSKIPYFS